MSDLRTLIVCPADTPPLIPIFVEVDADCGHRAWISPPGLALVLSGGVTTRCEDCVDPDLITGMVAVPGARDELSAVFGPAGADDLIASAEADPARVLRELQASNRQRRSRRPR